MDPTIAEAIGKIKAPTNIPLLMTPAIDDTGKLIGLVGFLNTILRLVFIVAGLWAFINFIIAGFQYINSSGDPKNLQSAWARIWQTVVGLLIMICSFLIAAIIGMLLFRDPMAILNPTLIK